MSKEGASRSVVELLIREATELGESSQHVAALNAASRAVELARQLDDLVLEIAATVTEAVLLRMLGRHSKALVRYTWLLGVAEDPKFQKQIMDNDLTKTFAKAYVHWVECGSYLPEIPTKKLFSVLTAGENWLRRVGRNHWRAGLLSMHSMLLQDQGYSEEALDLAEEALALKRQNPETPDYPLATHLWRFGNLLSYLHREAEAERYFQEVLDDSGSPPYDKMVALDGLADCALSRSDPATARQHAESAVRLAEGMGDEALCGALDTLVAACRAAGDLDAAAQAADRHLEAARRIPASRLYGALMNATDVALDRGDAAAASRHLDEAAPIAEALDRQAEVETRANAMARRRRRLAKLASEGAPGA
ncbi:MAG: tetratricopeptide repeat protein [bacterium]|nr:tetratricopeptide repeat protein [bacterium]